MSGTTETDRQIRLKATVDTLLNEIKRLNEDLERLLALCKEKVASCRALVGAPALGSLCYRMETAIAAAETP